MFISYRISGIIEEKKYKRKMYNAKRLEITNI